MRSGLLLALTAMISMAMACETAGPARAGDLAPPANPAPATPPSGAAPPEHVWDMEPDAADNGWALSTGLGWDSAYISRGKQKAKQNLTAEVELTQGNFYVGVWNMTPLADAANAYPTRLDVYVGSVVDLSPTFYVDTGLTGRFYPDTGALVRTETSLEGYVTVGVNGNWFNPALTGSWDAETRGYRFEASSNYSVPMWWADLVLGGHAGLAGKPGQSHRYLQADAELVCSLNDHADIAIGGHAAWSSDDTFLDGLAFTANTTEWFGVRLFLSAE